MAAQDDGAEGGSEEFNAGFGGVWVGGEGVVVEFNVLFCGEVFETMWEAFELLGYFSECRFGEVQMFDEGLNGACVFEKIRGSKYGSFWKNFFWYGE